MCYHLLVSTKENKTFNTHPPLHRKIAETGMQTEILNLWPVAGVPLISTLSPYTSATCSCTLRVGEGWSERKYIRWPCFRRLWIFGGGAHGLRPLVQVLTSSTQTLWPENAPVHSLSPPGSDLWIIYLICQHPVVSAFPPLTTFNKLEVMVY